jgi:transcriptional regulator with XRE-family HTH domain
MKMVNLVADQVSEFRNERGWTQDELTDRLQVAGWDISRSGLSKIENCTLYVPEFRLFYFAHVFGLSNLMPLLPAIDPRKSVHEAVLRFIYNEKRGLTQPPTTDLLDPALLNKARKHF